MSNDSYRDNIKVESIFHPSDFSVASEIAFAHALKMALVARARLSMLHVSSDAHVDWHEFPGVRETLERWKLIPKGSSKSAVGKLGIEVRKAVAVAKDPVKACLGHLAKEPADLVVLAVHHHEGRMRWFGKSVGEPLARAAAQMTLFIPHGVNGFVSREDGTVTLRNILIPVCINPRPQPAIEAALRIIRNLQLPKGKVTLLHVGTPAEMPAIKMPENTGWVWDCVVKTGDPVETILRVATENATDLILMTTDGQHGFLDGLRGTTSERVLRKAHCPVANLPVGSMLG